ncbi:hypothetical protein [Aliiroseovarius lamellibrachiae]|uniref:hypothetical protein n=1 Tax=Aliiroseovarius lamellibrachiae TaxID=1924933 RepID=UPI001BE05E1A|nr:hypothetical protein [Aliiroseovarius lamellibrachiae]MBT2131967.1 hypothetical protein [Aliiroseovarius lamellibrachiae]
MIVFVSLLLGGGFGALRAKKRGGTKFDIAQYAVVYALIFALITLFFTIFINR